MLLLFIIFARKKLYKPFLVILMTQNFGRMDNHSTCLERGHKIVNFMTLQPATQGGIIVKSVKFMYFLQISSSLTPEH